jgi:hypothetical protein
MSVWKLSQPRLESIEERTALSAGARAAPAAIDAAVEGSKLGLTATRLSFIASSAQLTSAKIQTVDLKGQATGGYTARQENPDTGALFRLNARGAISPIGSAFATGSFHSLGFISDRVATGTLTITGPNGTLHLDLTAVESSSAVVSTDQAAAVNPGGPMNPAYPAPTESTAGGTAIIVHTFQFQIVSGTGDYAHDRGTGTVQIDTIPGYPTSPGPGPYAVASMRTALFGSVVLNFTST